MESRSTPGLRERLQQLITDREAPERARSDRVIIETKGLRESLPRSMRTEIERYLREREAAVPCDVFRFEGDYYSLPNLVPLLSKLSRVELLMEIMEYPLPKRKPQ